ncbi:hypothetical protein [Solidesulfovibrio sp. C21]|uniref:hypothetical protein n=1 Tax=Solidesulfovibrio sp. C21 TaxID=3398613 RepID=UPI0039FC2532
MSRYPCRPRPVPALLALLTALALYAATAMAGVITVKDNTYSLDGGRPVTGAWEVAEKIAVGKDVAIVVMEEKANPTTIQIMLQLLESLHVPTLLTKRADYKPLVDRGVIKPTQTPAYP